MKKLLSTILITVVASFPIAVFSPYKAASLLTMSDTISDSRPSTASNHTIVFTTATLINDTASDVVTVTFPAGFDLTSITEDDLDLEDDGVDKTTAANCAGSEHFSAAVSGQVITFTACTGDAGDIAAGSVVTVKIGTNAADSGTGANRITNHATPAVYDIALTGPAADSGTTKIAIVATIIASVTITQSLSFTVTGQSAAQCVDYDNTAGTEVTTTATTVPFGTGVTLEAFYDACQELNISTNGSGGYTVAVKESDQLNSGTDTIADGTCDGGCSETAEADWATATNNGLGYCMQDGTGDGAATADAGWGTGGCDAANTLFKIFPELAVDTPDAQPIMTSTGPVNDIADIGYRLSVDTLQDAGAYTNNIIFIATPIF